PSRLRRPPIHGAGGASRQQTDDHFDYGSTHLPLSAGFRLQTLLAIARLTCTAQSSDTPGWSAVVHFAPIAAAVVPANKYPWQAALSAAFRTAATYPSWLP